MIPTAAPPSAGPFWSLDPEITFLNHGSFGSTPEPVRAAQRAWQDRLERQPVQFLWRELEPLLDLARSALAAFVGAQAEDLVFVPNATAGVNTFFRSCPLQPDDEILLTDHEYTACANAAAFAAQQAGARVVVAKVPLPVGSADEIAAAVLAHVTPRTRLALLDHVTSQTALIFPVERLVRDLAARGIETLVDGAHGPGMLPLDLDALGAAAYTGNCHKWLCAPKGAAFLHVRRDLQPRVRPLVISHGASSPRRDRSRFLVEFDWTGTFDPSAVLAVPEALRTMGTLLPGGWPELMRRNHQLALAARELLAAALGISLPCPDALVGSTAVIPLPPAPAADAPPPPIFQAPLQARLREGHRIEVPVIHWPAFPHRLLRVSAQCYNSLPQYQRLADALRALLHQERGEPARCPLQAQPTV
jgi:isopenicillin-N epimerase